MKQQVKFNLGAHEVTLETGRLAKQADASIYVTCGSNAVLVTVVSSRRTSDADFFPLTVEYAEKFYATGKIPGGYFKREGRPTNDAILNARLIDRPMRPLFPDWYRQETQIVATIMSYDGEFPVDILATLGASAAVHISDIPFNGPIASAVIGRVDGKFLVNPSVSQLAKSDLNVTLSGTKNGLLMVEGEAQFVPEADVLAALKFGHEQIMPALNAINELRNLTGAVPKRSEPARAEHALVPAIRDMVTPLIRQNLSIVNKAERYAGYAQTETQATEKFAAAIEDAAEKSQVAKLISKVIEDVKYEQARQITIEGSRIDGRDHVTIRPISCEVGMLPRSHGSGLFTRGETQVLGVVTLGTGDDEQSIDALGGMFRKKFMLHYNFPPYSVGETGRMGGQSRREIGHGNLAERALKAVIPEYEKFPYVVRVVSEVLESNGSSSMGTVCSGILALLDAGVPIRGNVAGIAMGLIQEGGKTAILSDILGDEDHLGDMDFKVAGTREGITALQMDIKIDSLDFGTFEKALIQAQAGRLHILNEMEKVLATPRGQISEYAPRIETLKVKPEKVREIIGAGGKTIKGIIEQTGVKINIEDDGTVHIASSDPKMSQKAIDIINGICAEAEVGRVYEGKVVKIMDFGAFVEVLPNTSGLLHISEIAHERIRNVTDVLNEGDSVEVKVMDIDRAGRIKLSRKALLERSPNE